MSITLTTSTSSPLPQCSPGSGAGTCTRAKRHKRGIADTATRWPDGVITVALDLKDLKSKALAISAIREWAQHTPGLQFRIISGTTGDIRISDNETQKGNWSYIGTEAKTASPDEPTLHVDRTDNDEDFRQTVLHEFGHALGLKHEHQHPEHTINWDKEGVYASYESSGLDGKTLYENLFELPTGSEMLVTGYDPKSIMHYRIDPSATQDGKGVRENHRLSKGDQQIIRKLYTPRRFQGSETYPAGGHIN